MVFRRVVHLKALFNEKYQYGENQVAKFHILVSVIFEYFSEKALF
jgi:hypothetical protein